MRFIQYKAKMRIEKRGHLTFNAKKAILKGDRNLRQK